MVWLLLLQALPFKGGSEVATVQFSFFSIALLWAASMVFIILRNRYTPMRLEDLDFAVLFGEFEPRRGFVCLPASPSINLTEQSAGRVRSRRKLDH